MVISKATLGGLEYYRRALQKIAEEGLFSFLQRTRTPNLARVADFDPCWSPLPNACYGAGRIDARLQSAKQHRRARYRTS